MNTHILGNVSSGVENDVLFIAYLPFVILTDRRFDRIAKRMRKLEKSLNLRSQNCPVVVLTLGELTLAKILPQTL